MARCPPCAGTARKAPAVGPVRSGDIAYLGADLLPLQRESTARCRRWRRGPPARSPSLFRALPTRQPDARLAVSRTASRPRPRAPGDVGESTGVSTGWVPPPPARGTPSPANANGAETARRRSSRARLAASFRISGLPRDRTYSSSAVARSSIPRRLAYSNASDSGSAATATAIAGHELARTFEGCRSRRRSATSLRQARRLRTLTGPPDRATRRRPPNPCCPLRLPNAHPQADSRSWHDCRSPPSRVPRTCPALGSSS
jgi:hypothetical protein